MSDRDMMNCTEKGILVLPETDSTNTYTKELARRGAAHGTAVLALRQTGGRGRMGRSFISPEKGLYMSVLLRPDCPAELLPTLTPCAAVAVHRALCRTCGVTAEIKWPNDLVVNGRKLCGILTEGVAGFDGKLSAVIGIGVNLNTNTEDFPRELQDTVITVRELTGRETRICELADSIYEELVTVYARWLKGDESLRAEYRELCVSLGRDIFVLRNGESLPARALDIGEDYSLLAEFADGHRESIRFGEVSIRPIA